MTRLAALHRQNQAGRDIADVDKVHDEIEIQLKPPAEKVPEHRCRRGKIVIMRSDRHRRCADHDRKT